MELWVEPRMKYHLHLGLGAHSGSRQVNSLRSERLLVDRADVAHVGRAGDPVKAVDVEQIIGQLSSSCEIHNRVSFPFLLPEVCPALL